MQPKAPIILVIILTSFGFTHYCFAEGSDLAANYAKVGEDQRQEAIRAGKEADEKRREARKVKATDPKKAERLNREADDLEKHALSRGEAATGNLKEAQALRSRLGGDEGGAKFATREQAQTVANRMDPQGNSLEVVEKGGQYQIQNKFSGVDPSASNDPGGTKMNINGETFYQNPNVTHNPENFRTLDGTKVYDPNMPDLVANGTLDPKSGNTNVSSYTRLSTGETFTETASSQVNSPGTPTVTTYTSEAGNSLQIPGAVNANGQEVLGAQAFNEAPLTQGLKSAGNQLSNYGQQLYDSVSSYYNSMGASAQETAPASMDIPTTAEITNTAQPIANPQPLQSTGTISEGDPYGTDTYSIESVQETNARIALEAWRRQQQEEADFWSNSR